MLRNISNSCMPGRGLGSDWCEVEELPDRGRPLAELHRRTRSVLHGRSSYSLQLPETLTSGGIRSGVPIRSNMIDISLIGHSHDNDPNLGKNIGEETAVVAPPFETMPDSDSEDSNDGSMPVLEALCDESDEARLRGHLRREAAARERRRAEALESCRSCNFAYHVMDFWMKHPEFHYE